MARPARTAPLGLRSTNYSTRNGLHRLPTADETPLVENFTLFSEHKAGLVKISGQNHQIPGANSAFALRPTPG